MAPKGYASRESYWYRLLDRGCKHAVNHEEPHKGPNAVVLAGTMMDIGISWESDTGLPKSWDKFAEKYPDWANSCRVGVSLLVDKDGTQFEALPLGVGYLKPQKGKRIQISAWEPSPAEKKSKAPKRQPKKSSELKPGGSLTKPKSSKPKVNQQVQDSDYESVSNSVVDPIESNNEENNDKYEDAMGSNEDDGPTGEHRPGFAEWLDRGGNLELPTAKEDVSLSPLSHEELRAMAHPPKRKRSAQEKMERAESRTRLKKPRRRPKKNKPADPELNSEADDSPYPVGPLEEAAMLVTSPVTPEPQLEGLESEMVAETDEVQFMEDIQNGLLTATEPLTDATAEPDQTESAPPVDPALDLIHPQAPEDSSLQVLIATPSVVKPGSDEEVFHDAEDKAAEDKAAESSDTEAGDETRNSGATPAGN